MAAPSSTKWGSIVKGSGNPTGRQGRIGIYTGVTNTNTQTTVTVQVWFATIYSCDDYYCTLYYNAGTNVTAATTSVVTNCDINHTVASGTGWSTSNQTKLYEKTYTYTRGTSDTTYKVYAKFSGIDMLDSAMYVNTTYTVPKLASYTVAYNANGGSGAPSSQTKWYGKALALSSTKPTRTGYSFQGWATSASGSKTYDAGGNYTNNAGVTLYAVWKANTYTVAYNANGGSGAPPSETKTHGVTLKLSTTKPTRTNYTFLGWSKTSSATTATYAAGANFTENANVTLYAVWKLAYVKPTIQNINISRVDSDGNVSDGGGQIRVSFNWTTFHENPTITVTVDYNSTIVKTSQSTGSGTSGAVDLTLDNPTAEDYSFESDKTYTVRITVSDSGGSTSVRQNLSGSKYTIDFLAGGNGVAIGKAAEFKDIFDVKFQPIFRHPTAQFDRTIRSNGTSSSAEIIAHDANGNPRTVFYGQDVDGSTHMGMGNFEKGSGFTKVCGHDIQLWVSNPVVFKWKPYLRAKDTFAITVRTAGYVTHVGKQVTFGIPLSVPIVGSPTVTVSSNQGFVLRQGGNYTHGSGESTYAYPYSYTAGLQQEWCGGIYITANFSNTTNAINNDAIGIVWSGQITFG